MTRRIGPSIVAVALLFSPGSAGVARADAPTVAPLTDPGTRGVSYSDGFVLHDDRGMLRLYPRVSLAVDFGAPIGAGVSSLRASDGSRELSPRVVLRRGIIEFGAGAFGFLDLKVGVEVDGRGTYGDRLLPGARDLRLGLQNAWINGEFGPALHLMAGIQPTAFSLERRTDPDELAALEPSIASQLAVPFARTLGVTVWGVTLHKSAGYDVSLVTGVGNTLPTGVSERGVVGRVFYRPFAYDAPQVDPRTPWRERLQLDRIQVGVSGRYTVRDRSSAEMSREDLTTGRGVALFRRRFVDSQGRTLVILPSGKQRALGFEAVAVGSPDLTLTGEAYVFDDETREAVLGKEATSNERRGALRGMGWYAQVSYVWEIIHRNRRRLQHRRDIHYSLSRALDPGLFPHPRRRDPVGVRSEIGALTTWQFTIRAGRVSAEYAPTKGDSPALYGRPDANSPGGRIDVWELGGVVSLWLTRIARLSASWQTYFAPLAGSPSNAVTLPGQLSGVSDAQWMHEVTLRMRMTL